MKHLLLGSALVLAPFAASAASHLELYYADQEIDDSGFSIDGDGFGGALRLGSSSGVFVPVRYESIELDDYDIDVSQFRAGLGYVFELAPSAALDLSVQYVRYDFDFAEPDGWGGFAGVTGKIADNVSLFVRGGFFQIEEDGIEADGTEFSGGASVDLSGFGVFAEYEITELDDSESELQFDTLRIGVQLSF